MASEPLNNDEPTDRDEPLFAEALQAAGRDNYLGDVETVQILLRLEVENALYRLSENDSTSDAMTKPAYRLARVFLGKNKQFAAVPGWNEPGRIDQSLADTLNLTDQTPDDRIAHVFLLMMSEILRLAAFSSQPGVLDEQCVGALQGIYARFASMLCGIPPVTQDAMILRN